MFSLLWENPYQVLFWFFWYVSPGQKQITFTTFTGAVSCINLGSGTNVIPGFTDMFDFWSTPSVIGAINQFRFPQILHIPRTMSLLLFQQSITILRSWKNQCRVFSLAVHSSFCWSPLLTSMTSLLRLQRHWRFRISAYSTFRLQTSVSRSVKQFQKSRLQLSLWPMTMSRGPIPFCPGSWLLSRIRRWEVLDHVREWGASRKDLSVLYNTTGLGLHISRDATSKFRQPMALMEERLACPDALVHFAAKYYRILCSWMASKPNAGASFNSMPMTTILWLAGWFLTVGRLGFNTTLNVKLRRLWKTITSSCTNVLAGLVAIGEVIILVFSPKDMFGGKSFWYVCLTFANWW